MVRCWKCGRENEEGMRFCTNCGTALTPSQAGAVGGSAGGYDPSSSETISFNQPPPTAVGMGGPTTPYTAPPFTEPAPPPKSKTGLIVGIIAAVTLLGLIAVGAVGAYYYYSNKDVSVDNGNNKEAGLDPPN